MVADEISALKNKVLHSSASSSVSRSNNFNDVRPTELYTY